MPSSRSSWPPRDAPPRDGRLVDRRAALARLAALTVGPYLPIAAQAAPSADDLRALLTTHGVPGASAAVIARGGIRPVAAGIADPATGRPVTDDTVFQAASLSKPVFACAVVSLALEGRLDLDRPLTAIAPRAFRSRHPRVMASSIPDDPRLARITPRHALSHASGLRNWARATPLTFLTDPGTAFGYSGEAYVYLQNAVEDLTGETLQTLVERRVLRPLAMTSSSFVWRRDYDRRAAIGSGPEGGREKWRPNEGLSAGTLHTTASDYARFVLAMLGLGRRPFPARLRQVMLEPTTPVEPEIAWGLGWGLEQPAGRPTSFWHWGDDDEFKAFAIGVPDRGRGLVVLTNGVKGLRVCRALVERTLPGPHPALAFRMLNY